MLLPEEFPNRIADKLCAQYFGMFEHFFIDSLKDRLIAGKGPVNLDLVTLQGHFAVGAVVRHYQVCHRVVQGSARVKSNVSDDPASFHNIVNKI